jgi:uncharacterized membrane protein
MVLYPIVAQFSLWLNQQNLAVIYLFLLLILNLSYPPKITKLILVIFLCIGFVLLFIFNLVSILIYLPPTLIPMILFFVFLNSLKNTPIITQFALKIEGKLSFEKQQYTKKVTKLWLGIFAFMVVESIILALLTPIYIWSWATHIGNYILIAIVFIVEFKYRCYKFQTQGFKQFIKAFMKVKYAND